MTGAAASKAAVIAKLDWALSEAGPEDTVVIFGATHGVLVGNEGYLMTWDSEPTEKLPFTSLPLHDLELKIDRSQASNVLLFADACHSAIAGAGIRSGPTNQFRQTPETKGRYNQDLVISVTDSDCSEAPKDLKDPEPLVRRDRYSMVSITPGTFQSSDGKTGVTTTKRYAIGTYEVTQGLYNEVMGSNPSKFSSCGDECPVESVSWYDAVRFANKLSELERLEPCYTISGEGVSWPGGLDCAGYRLPTAVEWEYAARAGEDSLYAGSNEVDDVAWHSKNSGSTTHPVGEKDLNGSDRVLRGGASEEPPERSRRPAKRRGGGRDPGASVSERLVVCVFGSDKIWRFLWKRRDRGGGCGRPLIDLPRR